MDSCPAGLDEPQSTISFKFEREGAKLGATTNKEIQKIITNLISFIDFYFYTPKETNPWQPNPSNG